MDFNKGSQSGITVQKDERLFVLSRRQKCRQRVVSAPHPNDTSATTWPNRQAPSFRRSWVGNSRNHEEMWKSDAQFAKTPSTLKAILTLSRAGGGANFNHFHSEILSSTSALVLGPKRPTTSATPAIAPAMKRNTANTPLVRRSPMMSVENTALSRLQL